MKNNPTIFIGYDAREHLAAQVCVHSIQIRSTERVNIIMLEHRELRRLGLFNRPWRIEPDGQYIDARDFRPFSTEFSHSRFLVFHIASELEFTGPCMFVDCDWLFLEDPTRLLREQAENPEQIGVVMRDREVEENSTKMDGMLQQNYSRKLWSALFTFTPSPKWVDRVSRDAVNEVTGRELHIFMGSPDTDFWGIDPLWHHIPSLDGAFPSGVNGIHYSEFSPWLNPEKSSMAPEAFSLWDTFLRQHLKATGMRGHEPQTLKLSDALSQVRDSQL